MMKKRLGYVVAIVACIGLLAGPVFAATPLAVSAHPDVIAIGAAYNGADLVVSGSVDRNAQVLVRVLGKEKNEMFKVKGKALGFLWMNMETIALDHVPSLMLLLPSPELTNLMSDAPETWSRLGLGFETLKDAIDVAPEGQDRQMIVGELMKLKQRQGLYGIQEDAVTYTSDGAQKAFSAVVHFPSALSPGEYNVEAYAVRNGRVLAEGSRVIEAREVGMPAFLTSVAFNHSLLYGVIAVLVAIFAGLITGYIFKGGQEAH